MASGEERLDGMREAMVHIPLRSNIFTLKKGSICNILR